MGTLQLKVWDSLFDPEGDRTMAIPFRPSLDDSYAWYRVYIHLRGPDLPFVSRVEYELPSGFSRRITPINPSYSNPSGNMIIETPSTRFEIFANVWTRYLAQPFRIRHVTRFENDRQDVTSFFESGSLGPQ